MDTALHPAGPGSACWRTVCTSGLESTLPDVALPWTAEHSSRYPIHNMLLIPINHDGTVDGCETPLPDLATAVCEATANLYQSVGFTPPWIGYLALADGQLVGTCGFKSAPRDGRVEIAYVTFPPFEGRGVATAMGTALLSISREQPCAVEVAAQTLPERNASHRILEKLGFRWLEAVEHPEDGTVWEWRLMPALTAASGGADDSRTGS